VSVGDVLDEELDGVSVEAWFRGPDTGWAAGGVWVVLLIELTMIGLLANILIGEKS